MTADPDAASRTYRDPWAPRQQILNVLNFYYPTIVDDVYGGYVAQIDRCDGHVYDGRTKHLTATCRATFNFSVGVRIGGPDWCRSAAEHGLSFLLDRHYDHERGGFDTLLAGTETVDDTRSAYGHAFALLALASATEAGLARAETALARVHDLVDERFWEDEHDLCADRFDGDWAAVDDYRGQNANMHVCEAMVAAHEATGDRRYLDRAYAIAAALVRDLAAEVDGLVWEDYTADWTHDGPGEIEPGHQAEWAKLLCLLAEHREEPWLEERAVDLFEWATTVGWDDDHGGFYATVSPEGDPLDTDKLGWPVAEAIGASALLGARVDESYWAQYDRLWAYAREHMINPKYGNWYRELTREHEHAYPNREVAVEPDYHPLNNAFVAMRALEGVE